jgi:hypothetical protein
VLQFCKISSAKNALGSRTTLLLELAGGFEVALLASWTPSSAKMAATMTLFGDSLLLNLTSHSEF